MLMTTPSTTDLLNRLLVLHARSLPVYLHYAPPAELASHPQAKAVLDRIVEDHQRMADRLGALILEQGGTVEYGEFPLRFTAYNDLSLKYLLPVLIDRQKKFIAACEKIAEMLATAPYAQAIAREAVGEAKGHLENLEDLQRQLHGGTAGPGA